MEGFLIIRLDFYFCGDSFWDQNWAFLRLKSKLSEVKVTTFMIKAFFMITILGCGLAFWSNPNFWSYFFLFSRELFWRSNFQKSTTYTPHSQKSSKKINLKIEIKISLTLFNFSWSAPLNFRRALFIVFDHLFLLFRQGDFLSKSILRFRTHSHFQRSRSNFISGTTFWDWGGVFYQDLFIFLINPQ